MTYLIASQGLLWLAIIVLTITVIALARQIGVLHERIAPVGALKVDRGPAVGDRAPHLELKTLNAGSVLIGSARPSGSLQLLLFVSPDCPVCKSLIPVAKAFVRAEKLDVVYVGDGEEAAHRRLIERFKLQDVPFALSTEAGLRFGVGKLPYAVLIDSEGIVASAGLVNSREHLESLVVARQMGVPSVQAYLKRHAAH